MADIVTRLRNPPFGTEASERSLMAAAADEIELLRDQSPKADLVTEPVAWQPKYKPEFIAYLKNTRADAQEYAPAFFFTRKEAEDYGYGGHDARPLYVHPAPAFNPDDTAASETEYLTFKDGRAFGLRLGDESYNIDWIIELVDANKHLLNNYQEYCEAGYLYQFETNASIFSPEHQDWADNHPLWKETKLFAKAKGGA